MEGNNINGRLSEDCKTFLESIDPIYIVNRQNDLEFMNKVEIMKNIIKLGNTRIQKYMENIFLSSFEGESFKTLSGQELNSEDDIEEYLLAMALAVESVVREPRQRLPEAEGRSR